MVQNVSDSQKVDYLWKKIGYGVAKTDIAGNIDATQEPTASTLQIRADKVMYQSGQIPSVIPGSSSGVVTVYPTTTPVQCTNDAGIPTPNLTWLTGITYWIPPEFGSTYQVQVFIGPTGWAANIATTGKQVYATGSGNNDEWIFDYQAGILQFNGANTPYNNGNPISFTGNSVYISGAVYSGTFGIPSTSTVGNALLGNITFSNTTISSSLTNANIYLTAPGTGQIQVTGNLAVGIPSGTQLQRPNNPVIGATRINTDINDIEFWTGNSWATPGQATVISQNIQPNGTSNSYVLSTTTSTPSVLVNINGTIQQPYTSYNVSGNVITFNEVPLTSDIVEVRFIVPGTAVVDFTQLQYGVTSVTLDSQSVNILGNILPTASNTYSIGSPTLEWSRGYFNTLNTTGNVVVGGNLTVLGTTTTVNQEIINQNENRLFIPKVHRLCLICLSVLA
jgi:hypothetical protein